MNRLFLNIQFYLIDLVAIERVFIIIKRIVTNIHDPIYRSLFEEN